MRGLETNLFKVYPSDPSFYRERITTMLAPSWMKNIRFPSIELHVQAARSEFLGTDSKKKRGGGCNLSVPIIHDTQLSVQYAHVRRRE